MRPSGGENGGPCSPRARRVWGNDRCLRALEPIAGVLLFSAAALGGAWISRHSAEEGVRRVCWLPADGSPLDLEVDGRLLAAPENDGEGGRWLRLSGGPEHLAAGASVEAHVLLRVFASPPEAMRGIEGLRRGDRLRVWCRLRRPREAGNPGCPDPALSLAAQGLDATGVVKTARLVEVVERGSPFSPARWLDGLKAASRRRLDHAFGEEGRCRATLGAMLLGDRGGLDPEGWRLLRDAGLVHILSISGLHVGLVAGLLLWVLRRTRLGQPAIFALSVLTLSGLSFFVGGQAPVLRSVLSACALLLGRAIGREGEALNTLVVVAAGLAGCRPAYVRDPGFQLSFAATAGILALAAPIARAIPLPRVPALSLAVSTSAYIATAPITAWHFSRVAPVSLLTNLLAAILCGAAMVGGTAAALLDGVPLLGPAAASLGGVSVGALFRLSAAASFVPGGAFRVPPPAPLLLCVHFALLVLAILLPSRLAAAPRSAFAGTLPRLVRTALALALASVHAGPLPRTTASRTEVAAIDVGQGQSVLFRGPSGGFVLVDAGGAAGQRFDVGERIVAPTLSYWGCRRIAAVVVSHAHDDHAGGVSAILREFPVDELWFPIGAHRDAAMKKILDDARERGVALVAIERGFRTERGGVPFEVLSPERHETSRAANERCIVLRAGRAPARVLVPADLEGEGEEQLLRLGVDLRAEALIVGHHGAPRGSQARFLSAVAPAIAVISVGTPNRFGHPDPGVLRRLRDARCRVYRTDRDGQVRIDSGAERWRVEVRRRRERE